MKKHTALAALALAAASLHVHAEPASQASIETLFTVTKTASTVEMMYDGVEQMMRQTMTQALEGKPLTPQQQAVVDAMPAKFMAVMRSELNWEKMKPAYTQLYRETFDQQEVDGLIAFYASPAGQAFINKMPLVVQKSMAISQMQMQALMPKIKQAIDETVAQAKAAN